MILCLTIFLFGGSFPIHSLPKLVFFTAILLAIIPEYCNIDVTVCAYKISSDLVSSYHRLSYRLIEIALETKFLMPEDLSVFTRINQSTAHYFGLAIDAAKTR